MRMCSSLSAKQPLTGLPLLLLGTHVVLDLIVALAAGQRDAAGGGAGARGPAAGLVLQLVDGLQDSLVPRLGREAAQDTEVRGGARKGTGYGEV